MCRLNLKTVTPITGKDTSFLIINFSYVSILDEITVQFFRKHDKLFSYWFQYGSMIRKPFKSKRSPFRFFVIFQKQLKIIFSLTHLFRRNEWKNFEREIPTHYLIRCHIIHTGLFDLLFFPRTTRLSASADSPRPKKFGY